MSLPLDGPLGGPVSGPAPSSAAISQALAPASSALATSQATILQAVQSGLTTAQSALSNAQAAISNAATAGLAPAQSALAAAHDAMDGQILGMLGTAAGMAAATASVPPPTAAALNAQIVQGIQLPQGTAPPTPAPPVPVFTPRDIGQDLFPSGTIPVCLHMLLLLADGTRREEIWYPPNDTPPNPPAGAQIIDGPKLCSSPFVVGGVPVIAEGPPTTPTLPEPPPFMPVLPGGGEPPTPAPPGLPIGPPPPPPAGPIQGPPAPGPFGPGGGGGILQGPPEPEPGQPIGLPGLPIVQPPILAPIPILEPIFPGGPPVAGGGGGVLQGPPGPPGVPAPGVPGQPIVNQPAPPLPGQPIVNRPVGPPPAAPIVNLPVQPQPIVQGGPPPIIGQPIVVNPIAPVPGQPIINQPIPPGGGGVLAPGGPGGGGPPRQPIVVNPIPPIIGQPIVVNPIPPIIGQPIVQNPVPPIIGQPIVQNPVVPVVGPPIVGAPIVNAPVPQGPGPPIVGAPIVNQPVPGLPGAPIINQPTPGGGGGILSPGGPGGGGIITSGGGPPTCPAPAPQQPIYVPTCPPPNGQQPAPPSEPAKNTPIPGIQWPQWCDTNVYKTIAADTAQLQGGPPFDFYKLIGAIDANGNVDTTNWFQSAFHGVPDSIKHGVDYLVGELNKLVNGQTLIGGAPPLAYLTPGIFLMLAQALRHFTGIELKGVRRHLEYWINAISPDLIPGTPAFNSMLGAAVITLDQWRTGVSANNDCPAWQTILRDAGRTRPGYNQYQQLVRLGLWGREPTEADTQSYNFTRTEDVNFALQLRRLWPGWSETLDWATRGLTDDTIAQLEGWDAELDTTFTDLTTRYADASGTDLELLKYRWRAHWRQLTPAEAFDAYFRLRPGQVPDANVFTETQLDTVLARHAVPPGLRPTIKLLARPRPQLRQLSTLYANGALTFDQTVSRLQDLGFAPDVANAYATSYRNLKVQKLAKGPEAKSYLKGGMASAELRQVLGAQGAAPAELDQVMKQLDYELSTAADEAVVAAIKKAFLAGDFDAVDLPARLRGRGLDPEQVVAFQAAWQAERDAAERHLAAAELTTYAEKGLIGVPDLGARLGRLGYTTDAVNLIVAMVQNKIHAQVASEQAKLTLAQQRAATQASRAAKQAAKAAQTAARQAERLRVGAAKASEELATHDGISAAAGKAAVLAAIDQYRALPNTSDAGALQLIRAALAIHVKKGGPTFADAVAGQIADIRG